jgi:hypothetical protein
MVEDVAMSTNYTADGTYWSGRDRPNGYLEVVRLRSSDYAIVEKWGSYQKRGSAVAAAAELAYYQGRTDAIAEMQEKVQHALSQVGLGAATVVQPDIAPEDLD